MPAALPDRTTCYIRNWIAFGEGYWNGKLYSRADCQQMGANFRRLSLPQRGQDPLLVPKVKIGHDGEQDLGEWLKASKGLPSLGTITGLNVAADGLCAFDLEMPALVGGLCNGGWYKDGSIEIAPPLPDPEHATRKLYPVCVAISLLGEEQPAVPLRYPMPKAVFADGTEVPAETKPTWLLQGAKQVAEKFSRAQQAQQAKCQPRTARFSYQGMTYTTAVVCFSAMTPILTTTTTTPKGNAMNPEKKAAMQAAGFSEEEIAKCEAALKTNMSADTPPTPAPPPPPPQPGEKMTGSAGEDPIAAMSAKMSADPQAPPYAKEMMSCIAKMSADFNKRFSATEAAVGDMQKIKPEAEMAAKFGREYQARIEADHRAAVERVVDQAISEGRLQANDRDDKITAGLTKDNAVCFAAGQANAGKTAFAVWRDELLSRKPSRFFAQDPALTDPPGAGDAASDPFVQKALASLPGGRQQAYAPATK